MYFFQLRRVGLITIHLARTGSTPAWCSLILIWSLSLSFSPSTSIASLALAVVVVAGTGCPQMVHLSGCFSVKIDLLQCLTSKSVGKLIALCSFFKIKSQYYGERGLPVWNAAQCPPRKQRSLWQDPHPSFVLRKQVMTPHQCVIIPAFLEMEITDLLEGNSNSVLFI